MMTTVRGLRLDVSNKNKEKEREIEKIGDNEK